MARPGCVGRRLAELLLVTAGDDVLLLQRGRDGVSVDVPENFDPTRRSGRVRLENVSISADEILPGPGSRPWPARGRCWPPRRRGAADCVDAAVAYAKVRQQFAGPSPLSKR